MSIPEPPSFDDFFNKQQAQRQQSTDSQHSQSNPQVQGNSYGVSALAPGQPFQDEPGSLSRRDSNASISGHRRMGSASSMNNRLRSVRGEGSGDSSSRRQDSFPFPIESTIISTAGGVHQAQHGQNGNVGDIMYAGASPYQSQQHPHQQQQQQIFDPSQNYQYTDPSAQYTSSSWTSQEAYSGQYGNQAQTFPVGAPATAGSGFMMEQQSPYGSATYDAGQHGLRQQQQQQHTGWGSEFVGQENRNAGGETFAWTGDAGGQESIDALLNVEDPLAELERM